MIALLDRRRYLSNLLRDVTETLEGKQAAEVFTQRGRYPQILRLRAAMRSFAQDDNEILKALKSNPDEGIQQGDHGGRTRSRH